MPARVHGDTKWELRTKRTMGIRLNTNTAALHLVRHLNQGNAELQSSAEKLSSGQRIQSAGDDAAGLSISEKLNAGLRSQAQGIRNASEGVGMLQVAEGAFTEIGNTLVRLRELAIQAASDTTGDAPRGFIDREARLMLRNITTIAKSTSYNGKLLLSSQDQDFHIHMGKSPTGDPDIHVIDRARWHSTAGRLGLGEMSLETAESARESLASLDRALQLVSSRRAEIGSLQNRLEIGISEAQSSQINGASQKSGIRDLDYASALSDSVKTQLLNQSRAAVMTQANQMNAVALKLIG